MARPPSVTSPHWREFRGNGLACVQRPNLVAPETAKAVRDAIDKLGWVANSGARTLASHRSRTIGAVIPKPENPAFALMMQAIGQAPSPTVEIMNVSSHGLRAEGRSAR